MKSSNILKWKAGVIIFRRCAHLDPIIEGQFKNQKAILHIFSFFILAKVQQQFRAKVNTKLTTGGDQTGTKNCPQGIIFFAFCGQFGSTQSLLAA